LSSQLVLDEQAARHFVTLLGDVEPAQRHAIEQWISLDPRHAVAFAWARSAWQLTEGLRDIDGQKS
jgi:ferric-dicitrate binding protein FerR (iron transport regulator)